MKKAAHLSYTIFNFPIFQLAWLDNKMALSYGAKRALKYSLGPTAAGAALYYFYKPYTMEEDDYEAMLRNRTARPVSRKAKGKLGQAAIANDHPESDARRPELADVPKMDLFKQKLKFEHSAERAAEAKKMDAQKDKEIREKMKRLQAELDAIKKKSY